jgi:hypothetical protein
LTHRGQSGELAAHPNRECVPDVDIFFWGSVGNRLKKRQYLLVARRRQKQRRVGMCRLTVRNDSWRISDIGESVLCYAYQPYNNGHHTEGK